MIKLPIESGDILGESDSVSDNKDSDFGTVSVSRVIPYLCGLSRQKRRTRKLIMARVFIDDSGSSNTEPIVYAGGWVGQVETWDNFANEWEQSLVASNPKPIKYFKHYEARSLTGCFAGFTESQASDKMLSLVEVISRHDIYGGAFIVFREHYCRLIQKHALMIKGRISKILADPFYACVNSLMCSLIVAEYEKSPNDKVDFIFDGKPGSGQANRIIMMYENNRDFFMPERYRSIMGTAIAMDDKEVLPLQAADLLAGQVRASLPMTADKKTLIPVDVDPEPLAIIKRHRPIFINVVPEEALVNNIKTNNVFISTRRLSTIKRERERKGKK